MVVGDAAAAPDRGGAAARLRATRDALSDRLASLVAHWPKYADAYAVDPRGFAQLETRALVDYMAGLIGSGDENYRHLYIGEKGKQFHDPSVDPAARAARETALLAGERAAFVAAVAPGEAALIEAAFDAIEQALVTPAAVEVKVLFVGDCLYLDVIAFLTAPALADGIRLRPSFVTTHDAAAIRAQIAALANERFDIVFYSPFTYALLSDYEALQRPRVALNPLRARAHAVAAVDQAVAVFDVVADLFECPIVAHAPAPILRNGGGAAERAKAALTAPFRRWAAKQAGRRLRQCAERRRAAGQAIHILDEAALVASAGAWGAGRYLYQSALQHPARFGALVAEAYRDLIFVAGRLLKRKLVVCDLDNTLWTGVIGEGLGVVHHPERHAPLLSLKQRGIVLAINSKNDPAKVVWDAAPGRLAIEDFVSRQINWDPKPLNMRRIAQHLNLKEKDFVFVDDRADERAMIEEQFPATLALDALDPRSWRLLDRWAALLPPNPGADRTDFYRQRDARQAFIAEEATAGEEQRAQMFGQLGLTLDIREAGAADLARVADLINRTNQFNMAGSRTTKRRIEELAADPAARILIADAADRFGTMGTISALVLQRADGGLAVSDFVLSCRVFGYGMEFAILEAARALASAEEGLFGAFRETDHNQPCRTVYGQAGFAPAEGGWMLASAAARPIAPRDWLAVTAAVRPFARDPALS